MTPLSMKKKANGIAVLTFNRPQVMNAGNFQFNMEMRQVIQEAAADDEVRVLIVTGAGRGFQSGDDVKEVLLGDSV